jgi:hypothetical protein
MARKNPLPQIGVRMEQSLRDEVAAEAAKRFGGNESQLLREGVVLYLALRRKLGVQFEPTMLMWLGHEYNAPPDRPAAPTQ